MFGLGMGELIVIGLVLLLLFGSKKLPELGGGLAKGIKNFKKGLKDEDEAKNEIKNKDDENSQ